MLFIKVSLSGPEIIYIVPYLSLTMENCIFCDIAEKRVNANIFYEDEDTISFLDLSPISKGHCLIVPKKHFENIFDIDEKALQKIILTAKRLALRLQDRLGAKGVNILHASGKAAQQSVPHFHIHLVPRYENDGLDTWPKADYEAEALEHVLAQIKDK